MATATLDIRSRLAQANIKIAAVEEKEPEASMEEMEIPSELRERFQVLCDLGFIDQNLKKVMEERKGQMGLDLLKIWAKKMWASRSLPSNCRVKNHIGPVTDCCANFIIKFRKNALQTMKVPKGMTFEEMAMSTLTSGVVGLTPANAKKFVQEEIVITENFSIDLTALNAAPEGSPQRALADKFLGYLGAQPRGKANEVKVPPITPEEQLVAFTVTQTVTLKAGLSARIFTYCDTEDQLVKLLQWVAVTKQISDFIVAESDEQDVRKERLGKTLVRFLPVDVKKSR